MHANEFVQARVWRTFFCMCSNTLFCCYLVCMRLAFGIEWRTVMVPRNDCLFTTRNSSLNVPTKTLSYISHVSVVLVSFSCTLLQCRWRFSNPCRGWEQCNYPTTKGPQKAGHRPGRLLEDTSLLLQTSTIGLGNASSTSICQVCY